MSEPSRAYRLAGNESPPAGIERIARGRIDSAVDELSGEGSETFAESVHEARKDLKKLRSVLRLVREEIGEETYRRENERYRDAGRMLSGPRDAEVKLETIDALRELEPQMPTKATLATYIRSLEADRDELAGDDDARDRVGERARAAIEEGREAVEGWALSADGWGLVAPGLARGYRRGRRRLRDTRSDPSAENVHEWRKRVKDLWYHLRVLTPAWPAVLGEAADQAHLLTELLGDHHDLAVLAEDARGRRDRFDDDADLDALLRAIERRQGTLIEAALTLGERVYAEKPKAFVGRLGAYWSAWRSG